jgi:hypothetical protein
MRRLRLAAVLLLPCLTLVSGCTEAVTFSDTMVGLTKELEASGRKFGEQVRRHEGDREALQEAYADAVGEVGKIAKRARAMRVPADVKGAKAYHEAFLAYIDFEEDVVDHEFRKIVSAASRSDRESLFENVQRLSQREQAEIEKMKAAQKAFAKANNLTVVE